MLIKPTAYASRRATPNNRAEPASHGEAKRARGKRSDQPLTHPDDLWRMNFRRGLPSGTGKAHAKLVWLYLCSYLHWTGASTETWVGNEKIARILMIGIREVKRALAYLEANGMISRKDGYRRRLKKPWGRIITLHLFGTGENPRICFPNPEAMRRIWHFARLAREKPIALVTDMVAIMILAAAGDDAEVDQSTSLHVSLAAIRAMVGSSTGSTATNRLVDLEGVGLISRVGKQWREGIVVHPPELACGVRYSETGDQYPRVQRVPRLPPPQLQRFPRQPAFADLITLDDLDAMRAQEASARSWSSPPGDGPWWESERMAC